MEFKSYTKQIEVNGHTVDVTVTVNVHDDDIDMCLDTYDTDLESIKAKVEAGNLFFGYIEVVAKADGLEGHDSLGACELVPNNMFDSNQFNKSVEFYLKEYGMEQSAITELVKGLETEYNSRIKSAERYKKYAR